MPAENNPYRRLKTQNTMGYEGLDTDARVAGAVRRAAVAGPAAANLAPPHAPLLLSQEAGLTAGDIDAIARRNYALGKQHAGVELDESRRREVGELVDRQAGIYDEGYDAGADEAITESLRIVLAALRPALIELTIAASREGTPTQRRDAAGKAEAILATVCTMAETDIGDSADEDPANTITGIRWLGDLIALVRKNVAGDDIADDIASIMRWWPADTEYERREHSD